MIASHKMAEIIQNQNSMSFALVLLLSKAYGSGVLPDRFYQRRRAYRSDRTAVFSDLAERYQTAVELASYCRANKSNNRCKWSFLREKFVKHFIDL